MVFTCEEARQKFSDDLPRFMASVPTTIHRKYGAVLVTQQDIDQTNEEIARYCAALRTQEQPQ